MIQMVRQAPAVERVEPRLLLQSSLSSPHERFQVSLELLDAASPTWRPRTSSGGLRPGQRGIVLAEKAADDLGLRVGNRVVLHHPRRVGSGAFRIAATRLPIIGIHGSPSEASRTWISPRPG